MANRLNSPAGTTDAEVRWNPTRRPWTDAVLLAPAEVHPVAGVLVVASVLGLAWLIPYAAGGAGVVAPHTFYFAIFLAGARFGVGGAVITAAVATVVAGPLLPLNVSDEKSQEWIDWSSRGGFFVLVGAAVSAAVVRLQEALRNERAVLAEARKLSESKALIIQSVSHEFRTPLTVMRGVSDLLQNEPLEESRVELIEGLRRAVTRLDVLVDTVLAASDALDDADARCAVDLPALLDELAGGFAARERVEISGALGAVIIAVDERLLRIALKAIVGHAIRWSAPSSGVRIRIEQCAGFVDVDVASAGRRFDAETLKAAFEPFWLGDSDADTHGEQLGLGLFAARAIIERAGGRIAPTGRDDEGNHLKLHIPLATDQ